MFFRSESRSHEGVLLLRKAARHPLSRNSKFVLIVFPLICANLPEQTKRWARFQ